LRSEGDVPPEFWRRWYWPAVSLAALLVFELTASPTLSVILLCCHFGLEDWQTGIWIWNNDTNSARGQACAWFSFARGVTLTLAAAFVLMVLLSLVSLLVELNAARGQFDLGDSFLGLTVLMTLGFPLGALLTLVACQSARQNSVKVWLDPGLHAARRAHQWPVSIQGGQNLADLPYQLMFLVLMTASLPPVIIVSMLMFPLNGPLPMIGMMLLGIAFALRMVHGLLDSWTSEARAKCPEECWGDTGSQPGPSLLDSSEPDEPRGEAESPGDCIDRDD
jgi:hypothetical protein